MLSSGLSDPTLAMAVVELNGQAHKDLPILGYSGVTWPNFISADAGKVVEANIRLGSKLPCRVWLGGARALGRIGFPVTTNPAKVAHR